MSTTPDRSRATAFGLIKEGEREQSGAYPIGNREGLSEAPLESDAVIAELAPELVSMIPEPPPASSQRPRAATPSERAELVFEDLSLSLDNPYLASSLVPPPKRPFPARRALAIAGGMLAAAGIGAAIQLVAMRGTPATAPSEAQAGITAPELVAAPAPVAAARPSEQVLPAIAETGAPSHSVTQAATVAVMAEPVAEPVVESARVESARVESARVESTRSPQTLGVRAPATTPEPAIREPRALRVNAPLEPPPAPREPVEEVSAANETVTVAASADSELAAADGEPMPELPQYPAREQVAAGFESVRAALAQCAAGRSGTAQIKATITSDGRIAHALVAGDFTGSPEGSCMAKAVREARFPAFAEPRLKVSYPLAL